MIDKFDFGKNDAGNQFSEPPYVKPDINDDGKTYENVRDSDLSTSAAENSDNLQFTRNIASNADYLRLLMPKYSRRVEVEDLNRNFWVIGQALNSVGKELSKEKEHFESTRELDRDGHDYSNYPHKIVFNEGIDGIKTPYMVKDYCYRSIETSQNFENDSVWSRQLGGYNSADQAYTIGGGSSIPVLNFYKPRPDAIPIFNLVQTDSSDVETFIGADTNIIEDISETFCLGKTFKQLTHGGKENIESTLIPSSNLQEGNIVIANVPEICPITLDENSTIPSDFGQEDITVFNSKIPFENLTEGQIVIATQNGVSKKFIKHILDNDFKNGFSYPKEYAWSEISDINININVNYVDQKFYWTGNRWLNLNLITVLDGPTMPYYQVVENGSIFRVLGDSTTSITDNSTAIPKINGQKIPINKIKNHDVVRNEADGICFEWWNGVWKKLQEHDDAYVNIFIWLPYKTATLRGEYYWTLKWLIPPGLGEY